MRPSCRQPTWPRRAPARRPGEGQPATSWRAVLLLAVPFVAPGLLAGLVAAQPGTPPGRAAPSDGAGSPAAPAPPAAPAAPPAAEPTAAPPGGEPLLDAPRPSMAEPGPAESAQGVPPGELPSLVDEAIRRLAQNANTKALRLVARKDYPGALDGFRNAYTLDPGNPEITNNLAYLYHLLGNHEAAGRLYRETLLLDPDRSVAHLNIADLLAVPGAAQEQLAEAAAHLTRARELRGNQPKLILRQARVAARRSRIAEAERYYRELLALQPPDDALRLELGDFYRDFGRDAEALAWYRAVRGTRPDGMTPAAPAPSPSPGRPAPALPLGGATRGSLVPPDPDRAELLIPGQEPTEGEDLARMAARRIWDIEISREARRWGWTPRGERLPASVHMLAARGRILANQGRHEEAERLLREALALAPGFTPARADLGDLLARTGRGQEAEIEYLRAVAMDHGNAETTARLGGLYLGFPGGGRAAEAALFFEQAMALRPDWTELHLELAEAYRATGDLGRALLHLDRFLPTAGSEAARERAAALRQALLPLLQSGQGGQGNPPAEQPGGALLATGGEPGAGAAGQATSGYAGGVGQSRPAGGPGAAGSPGSEPSRALVETLNRARALLGRGEPEAAMAELKRLDDAQRLTAILNLEAQILYAAGRPEEAAGAWRRSLALEEAQAEVHEQLGLLLLEQRDPAAARGHLLQAEALGDAAAIYHLARLDLPPGDPAPLGWWSDLVRLRRLREAVGRLERFLALGRAPLQLEEARRMQAQVEGRLRGALGFGGLLAVLAATGLLALALRRWGGSDLRLLIARHPEAGPDVQRILSAIRHEVLKHNTLVLTGLAEVLERQGADAAEKAAYCHDSLFGTSRTPGGAALRLRQYVAELVRLGRSHGERLNLRRRDPALAALLGGFALLERAAPLLERVELLSPRQRARLVHRLRQAARLLNQEGYEAVRGLLDELRILQVDRDLLQELYERTCHEPAFQGLAPGALVLELAEEPCAVHVPRQAFADILTNLIRNALQSSLRHGADQATIGLAVRSEVDPITGCERLVFLIRDRSPQVLTTEMIRGRYIEEGLGLTADLVSRYEGTLDVLPGEDGWAKSVVLKLPRVEQGTADGEEAGAAAAAVAAATEEEEAAEEEEEER